MTFKSRFPSYFSSGIRRQMIELYASTAIADLGLSLVMLFEPIFLYSVLGFGIKEVLWFFAAVYALYIVFIPFGGKIIARFGYENGIYLSIPFQILYWMSLFVSQDKTWVIYLAPVMFAIEKSLFWPAFHAIVAEFAKDKQRGREFSVLYAIFNIVNIIGPFVGGLLAAKFGITTAFVAACVIYFCSFIPLALTKERMPLGKYQYKTTLSYYKKFPHKFLGYLGFGEELLVLTVWPIFIFLIATDYESTGLLATIATLVATTFALYIGKVSDRYSKEVLIKVGAFFSFLIFIARFVANSFSSVFIIDALSRTAKDVVFIPLSAITYQRAEETTVLPYIIFFEQSLSIGKLLACLFGIILFSITGSFFALFVLAALFSLLYMYL